MLADPPQGEDLDSPLAQELTRPPGVRARFESDWKEAPGPRLEDFVDASCPEDRLALFSELLPLEIGLRRERGDRPCSTEYLAGRFPDLENVIVETFRDPELAAGDSPVTAAWNSDTLGTTRQASPRRDGRYRRVKNAWATTSCWRKLPGVAWGSFTRPGTSS